MTIIKQTKMTAFLLHGLTTNAGVKTVMYVLAYFTFEDGSKVMASAWQNTGYFGIPEIEEGAMLTLTFERAKNGISYLRKVERNDRQ